MVAIRRWRRQAGLVMLYLFALPLEAPAIALAEARQAQQPPAEGGDPGWPRNYKLPNGGSVVIYQPQIQSWEEQKKIVMWSAVSYTETPKAKPILGTLRVDAKTKVAVNERLVSFSDWELKEAHFKGQTEEQTEDLVHGLEETLSDSDRVISLDRVLANLDKSQIANPQEATGIKADPPQMFYSESPAFLMNLDGQPIWTPIEGTNLKYAVNTNWDLFSDAEGTGGYFLRVDSTWFTTSNLEGQWSGVGRLPEEFSKIPDDSNWSAVRANIPGKPPKTAPVIFIAYQPSEMILLKGPPVFQEVKKTKLLWVSNTESDIFRYGKEGDFYYLVSGRWFSAPTLQGPWTFATPKLPEDFKKIPLDHPRSRVLASVPGTEQALDAVLLAQIPITAKVNKKETKAPEVIYQGEPQFDSIPGTSLARAVNTDKDIIKVGDLYYMCFQAIWFMSTSPTGPWQVASSVPKEIYQIPPSSPSYNVTYVIEQESSDDEYAEFAYFAAYTGIMIAWGCAVWGSGYYYPPYYYGGYRPIYYPYPHTYGAGAWYNPHTGAYGRGAAVYGPYGGAGFASSYNPTTGTYKRGAAAYGPYNSRAAGQAYNPRTGTYAQTRQGSNVYGNWGTSSVQRGDQWVQTAHKTDYRSGTTTSGARTSEGGGAIHRTGPEGSGTVARTGSGDVYAGKDGNVYRKTDEGWQSWDNGGWSDASKPGGGTGVSQQPANKPGAGGGAGQQPSVGQQPANKPSGGAGVSQQPAPTSATGRSLDADRAGRTEGNSRSSSVSNYNKSGGQRSSAGSYRGGGGGRSGGRRR